MRSKTKTQAYIQRRKATGPLDQGHYDSTEMELLI